MRRLTLHASALNDEEYNLYTSSIVDLAFCDSDPTDKGPRDDAFYEDITVSVREARAWLRGRYPDIPVNSIDAILRFFSPALSQADTLSGGQFFAALRLVVHVQSGKEVDKALAFTQAHPASATVSSSMGKLTPGIAPPQLPRHSEDPYASITISATNPFSYELGQQPPLHPSQRQEPSKATHSPNNPFVTRSKSLSSRSEGLDKLPPLPPRKPPIPAPPPPRHASVSSPPPTRPQAAPTNFLCPSSSATPQPHSLPHSHSHSHPPPPPPPKPKPVTHVTSTLIKQSLQASKAAQTMKKAEEQLEKERVLQVLRSSAVVSGARSFAGASISRSSIVIGSNMRSSGSRSPSKRPPVPPQSVVAKSDSSASWSGSEGREKPPLPKRPPQQQPSPPMSTSSLEQVALAVAPSGTRSHPHTPYTSSPFDSPNQSPLTKPSLDLPGVAGLPPPTHPDRKPYGLAYQIPSTLTDDHSSSSSISPFRRNLESFEAVYGMSQQPSPTASSLSAGSPTTPTGEASSSNTPQQRMYRSKSLHHQHPPPPPPPTRRRRPESIQVLSNGEVLFGASSTTSSSITSNDSNNALKNSITQSPPSHRRSPHSSSFGGSASSSILGNGLVGNGGGAETIQRKLAELQIKAENALPKLEAARYKAEAGLSRRGFIQGNGLGYAKERSRSRTVGREDREGLMSDYCGNQSGRDEEGDGVDRLDRLSIGSGDEGGERGRGEVRGVVMERDELKWPAGEGWKQL